MLTIRKNFPVFVTGASGFIGGRLVARLLDDDRRVRVLSRRPLPELEARGVEVIPGDLHDRHALERGCRSADTVFHLAGRVGVWGPAEEFIRVNVDGTRNLIAAARDAKVPRFVYTSSPSVVYSGGDLAGVNESAPLCTEAPCAYPTSKAAAERLVLGANDRDLATVALRPHLVWGPGDRNIVPRVMALARTGRLRMVGSGRNRVDLTHIDNVVDAHLLAEGALLSGSAAPFSGPPRAAAAPPAASVSRAPLPVGGRAYFITNGEPVVLWDWINTILRGVGLPEVRARVPLAAAYAAGGLLEAAWRIGRKAGDPPMTRFAAKELATDHWFDITAARRDLGYHPLVTMEQGTTDLIAHYRAGNAY